MSAKLLGILLGIALLLWIIARWGRRHGSIQNHKKDIVQGVESWGQSEGKCEVCTCSEGTCNKEKEAPRVIYYDDEELDRFAERKHDNYSPEEIAEFQEVLETLLPEDVAGWLQSLSQRMIALPKPLLSEAEARLKSATQSQP